MAESAPVTHYVGSSKKKAPKSKAKPAKPAGKSKPKAKPAKRSAYGY